MLTKGDRSMFSWDEGIAAAGSLHLPDCWVFGIWRIGYSEIVGLVVYVCLGAYRPDYLFPV